MTTVVGVYGTLREGERLHPQMARFEPTKLGEGTIPGYYMTTNGAFPFITPSDDESGLVLVECYDFGDNFEEAVKVLDRIEGHPEWYERHVVKTRAGVSAWVYVMAKDRLAPGLSTIPSGDWKEYAKHG